VVGGNSTWGVVWPHWELKDKLDRWRRMRTTSLKVPAEGLKGDKDHVIYNSPAKVCVCICVCVCVCVCVSVCLCVCVSVGCWHGYWDPGSSPCSRAARALNCWAISSIPKWNLKPKFNLELGITIFFWITMCCFTKHSINVLRQTLKDVEDTDTHEKNCRRIHCPSLFWLEGKRSQSA